jgi:Uma2 family endonuclease
MGLTYPTAISPRDYLAWERAREAKHEYRRGDVSPMMGFTPRHNLISVSTLVCLHEQLRGSESTVYTSQMRVKTPDAALYTYPDVMIVSGRSEFEDEHTDTLLNPTVIIEILSEATADYDRGEKFRLYQTIPSFQEYALIAQHTPRIDHYFQQANQWQHSRAIGLQATLHLHHIDAILELSKFYEQVDFNSPEGTEP